MRYQELYDTLHKSPFEPFRIRLTDGGRYIVRHPDFAALTRTSILLFISSEDDAIPDRFNQYDLLHVVGIEPVNGSKKPRSRKGKRPPRR